MFSILTKELKKILVDYAEIRIEKRQNEGCSFRNGTLENMIETIEVGGTVRVLNNGNWSFVSFNSLDNLREALRSAKEITYYFSEKGTYRNHPTKAAYFKKETEFPEKISLSDKRYLLNDYYSYINSFSKVKNSVISYVSSNIEKVIVTTDNVNVLEKFNESGFYCNITADSGQSNFIVKRSNTGFSDFLNLQDDLGKLVEDTKKLPSLKKIESGIYSIILDPIMAGIFFHEAVGHLCEADHILDNCKLQEQFNLGTKLTDVNLNIMDDPSIPALRGSYHYDDEGVKAKRSHIIKNGIINSYLHSKETAFHTGALSTGNARTTSFKYPPIVRMSNLVIESGKESLENLLNGIKRGLYASGSKGGETELELFTFIPEKIYLIEDGEVKEQVQQTIFSGNIFKSLNTLRLGNNFQWNNHGVCHKKGQNSLPITIGSPSIRLDKILVGGN